MISPHKKSLGATLVATSSFFYASYGIWTTLMGDFFGSYTASAIRSAITLLILLAMLQVSRKFEAFNFTSHKRTYFWLLVSNTLVWGPLYYAILNAGVAVALSVNYAALMISMMFFGWLLSKEKITSLKLVSILAGLIGIGLVTIPSVESGIAILPILAAVTSGIGSGWVVVLVRNLPYNATQSTMVSWAVSIIANTVMLLVLGEQAPALGLHIEWFYLLIFSVVSVLASVTFITGLKKLDAGIAGVIGLLEIAFGVLFGVLLFEESFTLLALTGVSVIALAAGVPYIYEIRNSDDGI